METRLAHRSPSSSLHDGRQFMNAVAHVPKRARGISPLMRSEYQALSEREDGTNVGLRSRSPHTARAPVWKMSRPNLRLGHSASPRRTRLSRTAQLSAKRNPGFVSF
jgi:hypothetical protein